MSTREGLANELRNIPWGKDPCEPDWEKIADFIISDRKRIVEPLVKYKKEVIDNCGQEGWNLTVGDSPIDETLTNAGVEI